MKNLSIWHKNMKQKRSNLDSSERKLSRRNKYSLNYTNTLSIILRKYERWMNLCTSTSWKWIKKILRALISQTLNLILTKWLKITSKKLRLWKKSSKTQRNKSKIWKRWFLQKRKTLFHSDSNTERKLKNQSFATWSSRNFARKHDTSNFVPSFFPQALSRLSRASSLTPSECSKKLLFQTCTRDTTRTLKWNLLMKESLRTQT